jgi:hypothetical protein
MIMNNGRNLTATGLSDNVSDFAVLQTPSERRKGGGMKAREQEVSKSLVQCRSLEAYYLSMLSVAIALTLCSIKSALQATPVECELWSPFAKDKDYAAKDETGLISFPQDDEGGRAKRGRCLELV